MPEKTQSYLLSLARASLEAAVKGQPLPAVDDAPAETKEERGCFVTLTKGGRLRGCIGYIEPIQPLCRAVVENARNAALKDPRFSAVKPDELSDIRVEVSVLTEPKAIESYKAIRIGTDGIIVSCGWKKGVYLPEVATELGWDPKTFFESCALEKAGIDEGELGETEIEVFQTEGFQG